MGQRPREGAAQAMGLPLAGRISPHTHFSFGPETRDTGLRLLPQTRGFRIPDLRGAASHLMLPAARATRTALPSVSSQTPPCHPRPEAAPASSTGPQLSLWAPLSFQASGFLPQHPGWQSSRPAVCSIKQTEAQKVERAVMVARGRGSGGTRPQPRLQVPISHLPPFKTALRFSVAPCVSLSASAQNALQLWTLDFLSFPCSLQDA